jgi:cell division protein FtsN
VSTARQTGSPRKFPIVPVIFGAVAVAVIVTIILTRAAVPPPGSTGPPR